MKLLFNKKHLSKNSQESTILQEFIHHDGLLFKIYVIGETYHICNRPSLIIPESIDVTCKSL